MTQVQDMTNQQLNRALAELMGYSIREYMYSFGLINPYGSVLIEIESVDDAWAYAPDYCTDPADSLEVQTAACEVHGELYIWNLAIVQGWVGGTIISRKEAIRIATARPRERAEAAYITLSQALNGADRIDL
ncbi:hypothetical protein GCM10010912_17900 [Paenibacillus albidus]|uniref:Uncharacterized protein n=1 Tax=Paenibacillus albidus TaxID=2041023 RepID=A0A917C6H9_9BACL|nr:hypothetical protein [Paenibacillus albidus]GGF73128.1 hypothetical protein GCM10010912_17900 [Paenibacillus albidus]